MTNTDEKAPFEIHFDHDWQRQAWDEEMAQRRARQARPRDDFGLGADIVSILDRLPKAKEDAPVVLSCGAAQRWTSGGLNPGVTYCDGMGHYVAEGVIGRCPALLAREVTAKIESEKDRLKGELEQMRRLGGAGFDGYNARHCKGADLAYSAMREFAAARPPRRGVFMAGTTGLGKTRLLLASHFELLRAGVRSMYVTTPQLRLAFTARRSFDEERRDEGESLVYRLTRTQVIHLDDLGNVDEDDRKRGEFTEGLKELLDRSCAVWAAATNLTWKAAQEHPDVGAKIVSRLVQGAEVVNLEGEDYRVASATGRRG